MLRPSLVLRLLRQFGLPAATYLALLSLGACASSNHESTFAPDGSVNGRDAEGDGGRGPGFDGSLASGDGGGFSTHDAAPQGPLTISPANPVVPVTVDATGVHTTPVNFVAQIGSQAVSAAWTLDRGELGMLGATTGTFTASGIAAGVGNVTASVGGQTATTKVTVQITSSANGMPLGGAGGDAGTLEAGAGGVGGVGGEGLGGPVTQGVVTMLENASGDAGATDAGSSGGFSWLYPYDQTVWPQGILAPLLQWTTQGTAVYIHLKEANFEFQGFYSGTNLIHQPIDQTAWAEATTSNAGDPLHVELTLTDGKSVYGPIAEDWIVAAGQLKGTVYYSSYNTKLATPIAGETQAAAILAIRPGLTDPGLAVPGSGTKCLVCHMVSADGATLFASNGQPWPDYNETDAFDLRTSTGTPTNVYVGTSSDGSPNDRKFLWSGLWSDATFALQSSGHAQESYGANTPPTPGVPGTPDVHSRIFERSDGNAVAAPGFDGLVKEAVTPSFSPDGTKVTFNFWTAQSLADAGADGGADAGADAGLAAGNGHTLDLMDFACGPSGIDGGVGPDAGPSCTTRSFANLRRLYTNASPTGYPAWPAWLPDGSGIVFHNTVSPPSDPAKSVISTWQGATAQIWFTDLPAAQGTPHPIELMALDGKRSDGTSYLPTNPSHPDDTVLNYEPTVNPIVSGGYNWVVLTSRRMYGNIAGGDPYEVGDGTYPVTKKLWVAAIDLHPTPGKDPSHPAFYLPAQELNAPNMRGFWVVSPCEQDGQSCMTGDQCCGGYCRQSEDGGGLVCNSSLPPTSSCSMEFEKCAQTSDCCGVSMGYECINGHCAAPSAQ